MKIDEIDYHFVGLYNSDYFHFPFYFEDGKVLFTFTYIQRKFLHVRYIYSRIEPFQAPQPYSFGYDVQDKESYNNFEHNEKSDYNVVTGSYRVVLPDSRVQIVTYKADANGYTADVKYEGEAKYPEYVESQYKAPAAYAAPAYVAPAYSTPVYSTPAYTTPAYTTPAYKEPEYKTPVYTAPAYKAPASYPKY